MKKILKITLIILLIILLILLLMMFFGSSTFSKFKSKVSSSGIAEIATPIFNVEGVNSIKIDKNNSSKYNFSVSNYKNTNISQVEITYYIEILNNSEANLSFSLYDANNKQVKLVDNKSGLFTLKKNITQKDNFSLYVTYTEDSTILDDIEGNIQIKVEAAQIQEVI